MPRVVAGSAGGLYLDVPKKYDIRPTLDRIKGVIFSSLAERIPDTNVLDLYAGTGGLGIEALSRGAASAVFVEENAEATQCIKNNLTKCHLEGGKVYHQSVSRFVNEHISDKYDIIFADPPYDKTNKDTVKVPLLEMVRPMLCAGGIFVLEHYRTKIAPEEVGYEVIRHRNYGETCLTFWKLST